MERFEYIPDNLADKLHVLGMNHNDNGITYHQVIRWFIDNYDIHIQAIMETDCDSYGSVIGRHYDGCIRKVDLKEGESERIDVNGYLGDNTGYTYEQAMDACINKVLEAYFKK